VDWYKYQLLQNQYYLCKLKSTGKYWELQTNTDKETKNATVQPLYKFSE